MWGGGRICGPKKDEMSRLERSHCVPHYYDTVHMCNMVSEEHGTSIFTVEVSFP
jgi:hypothetical protein